MRVFHHIWQDFINLSQVNKLKCSQIKKIQMNFILTKHNTKEES